MSVVRSTTVLLLIIATVVGGTFLSFAGPSYAQQRNWRAAPEDTAVLTSKNDNARTGLNPNETILTTANVNVNQFGKRISYPVDGQVYAQPLFLPNVIIKGAPHNVVFAATENDSVYAFDADQMTTGTPPPPLWKKSFLVEGAHTVSSSGISCSDISPQYGITATPVIDGNTGTLYVVANTNEDGNIVYRLHALDVTTGRERPGSPVTIQATLNGTVFSGRHELERAGLLLLNGVVYTTFGSHCDDNPYHGWILGYDETTLKQVDMYNDTPSGSQGGIWQSGVGLAADRSGDIYYMSGNGTFDLNTGGSDAGDSFVKLSTQAGLKLVDYMTPFNQHCMDTTDMDLGSGGPILIPNSNTLIGLGKEGRVYVIDTTKMGHYHTIANPCSNQSRTNVDDIVQELPPGTVSGGEWGSQSYWADPRGNQFIYTAGTTDQLKAWKLSDGKIITPAASRGPETFTWPGANTTVSSNGNLAGTGIVWLLDPVHALRAYDAANVSHELYNSNQDSARDSFDGYIKFSVPTVANGEVFVGTRLNHLVIYGLLSQRPPSNAFNNVGISDDSNVQTGNFDGYGDSYSAQALATARLTPGEPFTFNGAPFTWPNVAPGMLDNYQVQGQVLTVMPVKNATTLAFLGSATVGPASGLGVITYSDGSIQPFTLGLSDWTLNGGTTSPSFGNRIAATMSYRNTPDGPQTGKSYVFYAQVSLTPSAPGLTVVSVTLPFAVDQGHLHVFAIALK